MYTKETNDIFSKCKILKSNINRLNPQISIKEYINEDLKSCTLDIIDKNISEGAAKLGLGEFEHFMSISYHQRQNDFLSEMPMVTAIDKIKKDDNLHIPDNCRITGIHSHNGQPPVLHLHIDCSDDRYFENIAKLISDLTNINRKNTTI